MRRRARGRRAGGFRAWGGDGARQGAHAAIGRRADDIEDRGVAIRVPMGAHGVDGVLVPVRLVPVFLVEIGVIVGEVPSGGAEMDAGLGAADQGGDEGDEDVEEARIPDAVPPCGGGQAGNGVRGMGHWVELV